MHPHHRLDPVVAAQLDGAVVRWQDDTPDGPITHQGVLTVPSALLHAACPCCESPTRAADDPIDFDHLAGCELAEELQDQRGFDEAALHRAVEAGLTYVRRVATGPEVDLWAARGTDARHAPVVLLLDDEGTCRRWWPTLAADS